jgi:ABC-type transporter Mla subunit MlaD
MKRTKREHRVTVLGGILFAVGLLVGLMFFAGFWTTASTYNISVYVHNARGIAEDSTVFEAGLPVGLVTGVQRNGPDAVLALRIDQGPRPIPVDSKIQLGLRSLAGEADVLLSLGHTKQWCGPAAASDSRRIRTTPRSIRSSTRSREPPKAGRERSSKASAPA